MLAGLVENAAQRYVSPYLIARLHLALDHRDEVFRWLERAFGERAAWVPFLKVDPRMDVLRSDPRFLDLLGRINFPRESRNCLR